MTPNIAAVAARLEPEMRRLFLAAVVRLRSAVDVERLVRAFASGTPADARAVLASLNAERAFAPMADRISRAAIETRLSEALSLSDRLGLKVSFAIDNPRAAVAAKAAAGMIREGGLTAAGLVRRVDDVRQAVAGIVNKAFVEHIPPVRAARMIRDVIGLTERQVAAVSAYRDRLKAGGTPEAKIDALTKRYSDTLLRRRAMVIARTESVRAAGIGQRQAWEEAVQRGLIDREDARMRWRAAADERKCDVCGQLLNGQERKIGDAFEAAGEAIAGPPAHPQCRCTLSLVFDRAPKPAQPPQEEAKTPVYRGRQIGDTRTAGTWWTESREFAETFANSKRGRKVVVGEVVQGAIAPSKVLDTGLLVTNYASLSSLAQQTGLSLPDVTRRLAASSDPLGPALAQAPNDPWRVHALLEQPAVQEALSERGFTHVGAREELRPGESVRTFLRLVQ